MAQLKIKHSWVKSLGRQSKHICKRCGLEKDRYRDQWEYSFLSIRDADARAMASKTYCMNIPAQIKREQLGA
jgi:hypothetical protein